MKIYYIFYTLFACLISVFTIEACNEKQSDSVKACKNANSGYFEHGQNGENGENGQNNQDGGNGGNGGSTIYGNGGNGGNGGDAD